MKGKQKKSREPRKWGNPTQVVEAHEQGRQDALNGRPMDPALKKHRNTAVAAAYRNGYSEGQQHGS